MIEYLVLTNRMRRCRTCREWTRWAPKSAVRSDWGLCLDHADDYPCENAAQNRAEALATLRAVFALECGKRSESHAEPRTYVGGRWIRGGGVWMREIPPPSTDTRQPHERGRS